MIKQTVTTKPRPNIAAIADILRQYKPNDCEGGPDFVLVNKIVIFGQGEIPPDPQEQAHTVDNLLSAMGAAWPEITDMAKELAGSIALLDNSNRLVAEIYERIMKSKPSETTNILEDIDRQANFLHRCENTIRHIANNVPPEKAKEVAVKFIDIHDPETPGAIQSPS